MSKTKTAPPPGRRATSLAAAGGRTLALRVLSIFGTRPEAIKMAPVVQALASSRGITSLVCVTGQHRQMLDQVLELFSIEPDYDLALMVPNQTLNGLAARAIAGLDEVLTAAAPDRVLVHGDTTTAMAASLAAFHRGIPSAMSRRACAPTISPGPGRGIQPAHRRRRGGPPVRPDAALGPQPRRRAARGPRDRDRQHGDRRPARDAGPHRGRRRLVGRPRGALRLPGTGPARPPRHRPPPENFGSGFEGICDALARLADRPDIDIVYPVHLNPNVNDPVRSALSGRGNVHLIEPLDYLPFVALMTRAHAVLTDSGGVQEEAPALGKPVLVMRDVTERPEAVEPGPFAWSAPTPTGSSAPFPLCGMMKRSTAGSPTPPIPTATARRAPASPPPCRASRSRNSAGRTSWAGLRRRSRVGTAPLAGAHSGLLRPCARRVKT